MRWLLCAGVILAVTFGNAAAAPEPRFFLVASFPDFHGIIASDGTRYDVPTFRSSDGELWRNTFAPDRAELAGGGDGGRCADGGAGEIGGDVQLFRLGRSTVPSPRTVSTRCQTVGPVLGPNGEIAYASAKTLIRFADGRTLRATKLPRGAFITELAVSPRRFEVAAMVQWGGGAHTEPRGAMVVISSKGTTWVAAGFRPASGTPEPIWSPRGDRLAVDHPSGHIVVSRDGTNRIAIARGRAGGDLVWSPDGSQIALTRRYGYEKHVSNGVDDICISDLDGSGSCRRLTYTHHVPHEYSGRRPGAWSPDGRRIAFLKREIPLDESGIMGRWGPGKARFELATIPAAGGPVDTVARFSYSTSVLSSTGYSLTEQLWWPAT